MGKGTWTFPFEFINRSYYLQAALYQIAVRRLLSDENTKVDHPRLTENTINLLKTYTLLDMQFIVVPKETTEGARIFQCTSDDIRASITGGKLKSGKEIEGLNNLLDRFIWHTNSGKWEFPMEVYENLGVTNLNVYES